jgi:tetratricopeptide (TPR) repeat protein
VQAARALLATATAASNDEAVRDANMLLGRAHVAAGDAAAGESALRAAKLPGKAPRRDAELTRRSARTRILALRCLATLTAARGERSTARMCYARLLATATTCAGSVAQMAALDNGVQPALEEALFDAPVLAGADGAAAAVATTVPTASMLTSSSAAELRAADADDTDAIHALRCALAAPMRLTRRAAAQRVRLLQLLAHRLLVTHSGAAFVRCDSAALVAVVGASAATSRRLVPRDVADEACVLLRLALAERQPTSVPTAERTADPTIDSLCLAAARRNAFVDVVPDLELELGNSPCDSHTQLQFALSLAAAGYAARAVERLRQWVDQFRNSAASSPIDMVSVHLLVAKLLLNDLGAVVEANAEARVALQHAEQQQPHNKEAIAAAALAVGVTSAARARLEHGGSRRERLQADARTMLRRAARLNPVSGDVAFALALAHADVRTIAPALELARAAVSMRGDAASWNLLALLLSSRRRYKRALAATKAGLKLGDDIELLRTQAQLQCALNDTPGAMRSLMRAFATFRTQRSLLSDNEQPRLSRGAHTMSGGSEPSVLSARTFDESDRRTSDVRSNGGGGAARSQTARSVVGSPIAAADVRSQGAAAAAAIGAAAAVAAQDGERPSVGFGDLDLWLDVGRLFCAAEQFEEAHSCLTELRKLMPLEADVLAFEASLAHARGRVDEADQLCEKLLSLYPTHTDALQLSGALLLEREQTGRVATSSAVSNNSARLLLAEQRLQQAVRQNPMSHEAWLTLGRVLLAKGENERAAECLFTQIELENTAPVRPFCSAVPFVL